MLRWRTVPNFSKYEVSERGDVRRHLNRLPKGGGNRCKPGQLLKPVINKNGYVAFCLRRDDGKYKTLPVSQLLAYAFLGPRPSPAHCALHKDDNKLNNTLPNIYWGTVIDNAKDRRRNGGYAYTFGSERA